MKGLSSKVAGIIAGLVALFGISAATVTAAVPDISAKSPLYLEHGKAIGSSIGLISQHGSHSSHESHQSHYSHRSGY